MRKLTNLYNAAGTAQTPTDTGVFTLANATTYYAELFDDVHDRTGHSIHWDYSATLVATITIEGSNRPRTEVTSYSATGWFPTSATTVSPAASAAEVGFQGADYMGARVRAKIVVTTGGTLRGDEHSKARGAR